MRCVCPDRTSALPLLLCALCVRVHAPVLTQPASIRTAPGLRGCSAAAIRYGTGRAYAVPCDVQYWQSVCCAMSTLSPLSSSASHTLRLESGAVEGHVGRSRVTWGG
eukprot:2823747-Rhodomonas_salina.1